MTTYQAYILQEKFYTLNEINRNKCKRGSRLISKYALKGRTVSRKNSSHLPNRKSCQYQLFVTVTVSYSGENVVTSPSEHHFFLSYISLSFSPACHLFSIANIKQKPNGGFILKKCAFFPLTFNMK